MRLYQGPNEREGYVLVCINKRWGSLCGDDIDANTKTICTQLGYMDGEYVNNNCIHINLNGSLTGNYVYNTNEINIPVQSIVLSCNGDESRIYDCVHDYISSPTCWRKVSIRCKPGNIQVYNYDIS